MAVVLVTYDLNKERNKKGDYDKFYKIRDTYDHVRLSESSYAFSTTETPQQIWDKLRAAAVMDEDDTVYVVMLRHPIAGQGPSGTNEWLNFHLQFG